MRIFSLEFLCWLLFAILADRGVLRVSETSALPESAPPVVVIDSGHGGDDPGKVGINQSREKEINLAIAKKLEQRLTENGITVIMTRETDEDLSPPGAAQPESSRPERTLPDHQRGSRALRCQHPSKQLSRSQRLRPSGLLL